MKHTRTLLIYVLTLLLAVVGTTSVQAQAKAVQDALYIYRNDGGFNAFFYKDIERFEYSCIDTLGIEHDDYVVQEIYALDTLVRIPLSAIDSVAFVTPETVYQEDVAHLAESSLWDYVIGGDTLQFTLASNTPAALVPKVGDKVVRNTPTRAMAYSVFGRVSSVTPGADGIVVGYESISTAELFKQYVGKAMLEAEGDPLSSVAAARRVGTDNAKGRLELSDGNVIFDTDLQLPSYTSSGDGTKLADLITSKLGPITFLLSSMEKYTLEVKPKVSLRAFYTLSPAGEHYTVTMRGEVEREYSCKGNGSLTIRCDFSVIPALPIPLGKVPLIATVTYGPSFNISGSGEYKIKEYEKHSYYASVQKFTAWVPYIGDQQWPEVKSAQRTVNHQLLDSDRQHTTVGSFSFQSGVFLNIGISDWGKIAQFNARTDAAHKYTASLDKMPGLSFQLPANATEISQSIDDYKRMSRDGSYTETTFIQTKLLPSVGFGSGIIRANLAYTCSPWYKDERNGSLLPQTLGTTVEYDSASKTLKTSSTFAGLCPYGVFDGVALYQDNKPVKSYFSSTMHQANSGTVKATFTGLPDGKYDVYPAYSVLGFKYLGFQDNAAVVGTPVLEVEPTEVEFTKDGGTENLKCIVKLYDKTELRTGKGYGEWWTAVINDDKLIVTAMPTKEDELDVRESSLWVVTSVKGAYPAVADSVEVKIRQVPYTAFSVSPDTLLLPGYTADFEQGRLARAITVRYPLKAKEVKVTSDSPSWLIVKDGWDDVINDVSFSTGIRTVYVTPNTSLTTPRDGKLTVVLTKANGTTETQTIRVHQDAMTIDVELEPGEVMLKARESEGAAYSDRKLVNIKIKPLWDDVVASVVKNQDLKPDIDWIKVERDGNKFTVYGEFNPVYEPRTNYVTYTLTPVTGEPIVRKLKVTQQADEEPMSLCDDYSPNPIRLGGAADSEVNVTFNCPNIESIIGLFSMSQSWLEGGGSGRSLTLRATKANTTGETRQGNFELTFRMKDGTTAKQMYVAYQEPLDTQDPSVAHVYPTALYFSGDGGSQIVQVYKGQYNRAGHGVSSNGQSWVSIANYADSDGTLKITVKPNTTGVERTCTAYCYMASFEGDSPAPGTQIESFPITITQAANELAPGQIAMTGVLSCSVMVTSQTTERGEGGSTTTEVADLFTDLSFSQKGTTVHVSGVYKYQDGYDVYQSIVDFDIKNFGGNFANCKIENLTFQHIYTDTYIDYTQPGVYGTGVDIQTELTNLLCQDGMKAYVENGKSIFTFGGSVSDGVTFTKLVEKRVNNNIVKPTQYFDYVANGSNKALIILEFKAVGKVASSRGLDAVEPADDGGVETIHW